MFLENLQNHTVILASGSPRRQELMKKLDIPFEIRLKEVEEIYPPELKRDEITNFLAKLKAQPFLNSMNDQDIIITSDTIVWHKGKALGKPNSKVEAKNMLQSLSGCSHEVISSICITTQNNQKLIFDVTLVYFKELKESEIDYYLENYNPMDKAGAYGIQEWIGLIAVDRMDGSYFNVMGFPVNKLQQELSNLFL